MRIPWAGSLRLFGGLLGLVSCIPMFAMLPAGFVGFMALLGFTAPPIAAWAAPLAPIAPLLLILSVGLLVIGNLHCGWQPSSLAAVGGSLTYLAMYVFVIPPTMDAMAGMQEMTSVEAPQTMMPGLTNAPIFYVGLALMIGSLGLVLWRRWQKICRPFNPLAFLRTMRQD